MSTTPKPGASHRSVGQPVRARSVLAYAGVGIGIGLLGILIAAALLQWLALAPNNQRMLDLQRDARAQAYVEVLNSRVLLLQQQGSRIAATPAVQIAMAGRDRTTLSGLELSLGTAIGSLRGVRLYVAGAAAADPTGSPPINFSALEMVRAVERGEDVLAQAFRVGGQLLVYSVTPIKASGGGLAGTVLLVSDPSYLEAALGAIDSNAGKIQLVQQFSDSDSVTLFEVGGNGTGQPLSRATRIPHWTIVFDPSNATVADASVSLTSLLPAFVAVLFGTFGAIGFPLLRLRRNLSRDLLQVRNSLSNRSHDTGGFHLLELATVGAKFASLSQRRAEAPPAPIPDLPAAHSRRAPTESLDVELPLEITSALDVRPSAAADRSHKETSPKSAPIKTPTAGKDAQGKPALDPSIFRAYDVRGIVDQNLGEDTVYQIGRALGSEAISLNIKRLVVGSDGRLSSPSLRDAITRGLRDCGIDVIDIGEVPTPVMYFATHFLRTGSGVMITGEHYPPDHNGLKMMLGGETLTDERIQRLRERIEQGQIINGKGSVERADILRRYIDRIAEDVTVAQSMKVVVDCGNGIAGKVAPDLLRALGCEVVELFCEVDGTFPNHPADPSVAANLDDLIDAVRREKADLGLAFDADGGRLGVVTDVGRIIWPDRLMMLLARDVVGRNPGCDVIYDVACSRHLSTIITDLGGRPIMWRSGHPNIKAKIKETGALLGGEFSGHIAFLERWYGFDDALYTASRLLEIVGASQDSVDDTFGEFPDPFGTPEIRIETTEARKFEIINALSSNGNFDNGSLNNIDGVRVEFNDGWGLVRASNSRPELTLRFEADTGLALARITNMFQRELIRVDPMLTFDLEAP